MRLSPNIVDFQPNIPKRVAWSIRNVKTKDYQNCFDKLAQRTGLILSG
ncbi:hypothetical protein DSCO28_50870 [Desulfosarcina ovata subsp. sediminis]|uniref:Uncharacterized protein n=1 Tax=Desulfosarcina ovata subsp. sediminis TaxID=885957 RepID=A0A5K7ZWM9_9BACT|nr:hypothetical protein DSCO28_50870 [Desulfosarcina ovata subsp. sediminis]